MLGRASSHSCSCVLYKQVLSPI